MTAVRTIRRQRGAAALVVTMVLFFAMVLVAAFANRGLLFEQRSSANQYRATQAFEAAEAGLEWALARLNDAKPLDAECRPSADPAARTLRERLLQHDPASGSHAPITWLNGGAATALQPACVRTAAGWQCSCPTSGHAVLTAPEPAAGAAQPAFAVRLAASARPGVLQLLSTGCTRLAGACDAAGTHAGEAPDATQRVQVAIALVPGIATLPLAPLTVHGAVGVGSASLGLHNSDAGSGGVALHAGGSSDAVAARITTVPGGNAASASRIDDAALAAHGADGLFAAFFGIDKSTWRGQAAVRRIACPVGDCAAALVAAIGGGSGNAGSPAAGPQRLIWVDGDLALSGPLVLGAADRPLLVVASGAVQLRGALAVHGLIYGASLAWNDTPAAGGWLRGALISEAGYGGNGAPDLIYDAAVLDLLRTGNGSFTRVPGSWRDF